MKNYLNLQILKKGILTLKSLKKANLFNLLKENLALKITAHIFLRPWLSIHSNP